MKITQLLSCFVALTYLILRANGVDPFGLMIDAGSSGSRIYVYTWKIRTSNTIPDVIAAPPDRQRGR